MPKTIKDITIEDVQDLFDSVIFLRGEEYFEEDCVKSIEPANTDTITGIVRGNQNYNVIISIDSEDDIICDCSCPCDFNCKHSAAMLLKWLSIKGKFNKELKDTKREPKESIDKILARKSKEELIELMEAFIGKHPELKAFVKIERKEIISKIRRLFSDFWEWDEVRDLISQLETILEGIRRNKGLWDKDLLNEMKICSDIMIKGVESVHDEGDLGIFLEDWFKTYGEIFSKTNPTTEQKKLFIKNILDLIDKDDYGLDSSYEKALIGMCAGKEDIELIQWRYKPSGSEHDNDEDYYKQFYLELYDKIGMNDKYLEIAKESGFNTILIDKLISLNRLDEALIECKKTKGFSEDIENKKIVILRKLGDFNELQRTLLTLLKRTGDFNYAVKLKQQSSKEEWEKYFKDIAKDAKRKNRNSLLSRIYYNENDFRNAYEHSKNLSDSDYLELLAKKLSIENPELACNLFKKLCFSWIKSGSGWPYKKAGKMLESIKMLDKKGSFFGKTREEITALHKKKYSLMEIINRV
ncbi:MAG: SWIM zinc finger family protein [Nanoarchaeota archaeon]